MRVNVIHVDGVTNFTHPENEQYATRLRFIPVNIEESPGPTWPPEEFKKLNQVANSEYEHAVIALKAGMIDHFEMDVEL